MSQQWISNRRYKGIIIDSNKMIFFAIALAFIAVIQTVLSNRNITLSYTLATALFAFSAVQLLKFKRKNSVLQTASLVCSLLLLNLLIMFSGGIESYYLLMLILPVFIYTSYGNKRHGWVSLVVNTSTLAIMSIYFILDRQVFFDEHVINAFGIMGLMWLSYQLILNVLNKTEQFRQEAENLIQYDEQTKLYRYRLFNPALEGWIKNWHESNKEFKLLLLDLGNLGYYNTNYGYETGDEVIAKTASALKRYFKKNDQVFRYSGDQFAVLTSMTSEEADYFISHFKLDVRKICDKLGIRRLKVLVGYANCPEDGIYVEKLLNTAIERLKEEKGNQGTEEIEKQKRAEKMALVGQLAAGLAHELRNPITSVKGFCQLAKESTDDPRLQQYLNYMTDDVNRLAELIGDFLLLSKPSPPQLEAINVIGFVQEIIDLLESQARLQEVAIMMQIPSYLPNVHADKEQLRQALVNVIINSFEAMPEGGEIFISLATVTDKIVISFEDTGQGIEDQDLLHVFNPFFTTKDEGTGLGLAVTQKIVSAHNGDIIIRSEQKSGTVVSIYLPISQAKIGSEELAI